jgi:hypothetical protein
MWDGDSKLMTEIFMCLLIFFKFYVWKYETVSFQIYSSMSFIIRLLLQYSLRLFIAGFLLGLFFHPEDGVDTFLPNVCGLLLISSCNNGIYFSCVYKSFQIHARTCWKSFSHVCLMHLLTLCTRCC